MGAGDRPVLQPRVVGVQLPQLLIEGAGLSAAVGVVGQRE